MRGEENAQRIPVAQVIQPSHLPNDTHWRELVVEAAGHGERAVV